MVSDRVVGGQEWSSEKLPFKVVWILREVRYAEVLDDLGVTQASNNNPRQNRDRNYCSTSCSHHMSLGPRWKWIDHLEAPVVTIPHNRRLRFVTPWACWYPVSAGRSTVRARRWK